MTSSPTSSATLWTAVNDQTHKIQDPIVEKKSLMTAYSAAESLWSRAARSWLMPAMTADDRAIGFVR
jgi:hypothetical protein